MNVRFSSLAALVAGAAVLLWVALGYLGSHPLALVITLLIAAFYGLGAWELARYRVATLSLETALSSAPALAEGTADPAEVDRWLVPVHASLREPVRLRLDGVRAALPGPALAPYLSGLLVLLGMLGTFLGLVVTLDGAVQALERTTDLDAMRAALSAPVKGLGLAFGTSVAGVAASAMLGLMATLARRERGAVSQRLDARISGPWRGLSMAHRRDKAFQSLARQADALPELVAQMRTALGQMGEHQQQLAQRLGDGQDRFHREAQASYGALAQSVDRSLRESLSEAARVAGATLQPVAEATMARLAEQTTQLQQQVHDAVAEQTAALGERVGQSVMALHSGWTQALAQQAQGAAALGQAQTEALSQVAEDFGRRTEALLAGVERTQASGQAAMQAMLLKTADDSRAAVTELITGARSANTELVGATQKAHAELAQTSQATQQNQAAQARELLAQLAADLRSAHAQLADSAASQVQALAAQLRQSGTEAALQWREAVAQQQQAGQALADTLARTQARLADAVGTQTAEQAENFARRAAEQAEGFARQSAAQAQAFAQRSAELLAGIEQAQGRLRNELSERDDSRQGALVDSLRLMSESLHKGWREAGQAQVAQHADLREAIARSDAALRETLAANARELQEQAQAQTRAATAEVARLMQAAAEAPRAAAEAMTLLREKLADSLKQDKAHLAEREQLMASLRELLAGAQQQAQQQRAAVDALVQGTAQLLARTGERFAEQVGQDAGQIRQAALQAAAGVGEVSTMGEAFAASVQQFGQTSQALLAGLQRIESALQQQMLRSDDQMAYYVAQAREIVDLSLGAQKQIIDDLQRLAPPPDGGRMATSRTEGVAG